MKNQMEEQTAGNRCAMQGRAFGFLVAGFAVGAGLSVLFAPRSGADTRKRIASKVLDKMEAANAKVRDARTWTHEMAEQGQAKVTAVIAAQRETIGMPEAGTTHPA